MRNNGNRIRQKVYTSNCNEYMLRGTAEQISQKYIEIIKDAPEHEQENLKQHAHHWATLAHSEQSNHQRR